MLVQIIHYNVHHLPLSKYVQMDFILLLFKEIKFHVLNVHKLTIKLLVIMPLMQLAVKYHIVQLMELVHNVTLMLLHVMENLLTNV